MRYHQIGSIHCKNNSFLGYRMVIDDLKMTVILTGKKTDLFEITFDRVQSYKFVPDDLAKLPEQIELDALQKAVYKDWVDDFRIPSEVHRRYFEGYNLYLLHATDVGILEVVAVSGELREVVSG